MKYQDMFREEINNIINKKLEFEDYVNKKMQYAAQHAKDDLTKQIDMMIENLCELECDTISLNKIIKPQDNNLTIKGA